MSENLMSKAHKATNQAFRDHWDETFLPIGKRLMGQSHTARILKMSEIQKWRLTDKATHSLIKAGKTALEIEKQFRYHQDFNPFYGSDDLLPQHETKK